MSKKIFRSIIAVAMVVLVSCLLSQAAFCMIILINHR